MVSLSAPEFVSGRVWNLTLLLWLWFIFLSSNPSLSYRKQKVPKDIFLKKRHNHAILVSIISLKGHFQIPLPPWQAGRVCSGFLGWSGKTRREMETATVCDTEYCCSGILPVTLEYQRMLHRWLEPTQVDRRKLCYDMAGVSNLWLNC